MSERKVLNKYYPIDYDPRRLPRQKDHGQQKVTTFASSALLGYHRRFLTLSRLLNVHVGCGQYRGQNYGHSYYGTLPHEMQNLW